ncbi:MAG: ATP-grasp domain-containing protein [Filomicrobium sp.]
MRSILLLGNYRPTLTLARQLAPLGYRIIVTRGGGEGCSEFSRYVSECWDHPPIEDETSFFAALNSFLRQRPDIEIILPVWEPCVTGLAKHQKHLPQDRVYATPSSSIVQQCLNKMEMVKLAAEVGVPCAKFAIIDSFDELREAGSRVDYPFIVRPLASSLPINGRKAVICHSEDEFKKLLPEWPEGHRSLIVQEYVEGPRYNVYFAAQHGKPLRLLAAKILRTHLRDGTGLAVDGLTVDLDDDLKDATEKLLSALDYTGVGCVQFIVDRASERLSFLELNPRIAGNHAVPEACGLELSRLAVDLAEGGGTAEPHFTAKGGKRYAWTYCDLRGLRVALQEQQIGGPQALSEFGRLLWLGLRAPIHMTWDWRDPVPTLALFANQIPGLSKFVPSDFKRPVRDSQDVKGSLPAASAPLKAQNT